MQERCSSAHLGGSGGQQGAEVLLQAQECKTLTDLALEKKAGEDHDSAVPELK